MKLRGLSLGLGLLFLAGCAGTPATQVGTGSPYGLQQVGCGGAPYRTPNMNIPGGIFGCGGTEPFAAVAVVAPSAEEPSPAPTEAPVVEQPSPAPTESPQQAIVIIVKPTTFPAGTIK